MHTSVRTHIPTYLTCTCMHILPHTLFICDHTSIDTQGPAQGYRISCQSRRFKLQKMLGFLCRTRSPGSPHTCPYGSSQTRQGGAGRSSDRYEVKVKLSRWSGHAGPWGTPQGTQKMSPSQLLHSHLLWNSGPHCRPGQRLSHSYFLPDSRPRGLLVPHSSSSSAGA